MVEKEKDSVDFNRILTWLFNRNLISMSEIESDRFQCLNSTGLGSQHRRFDSLDQIAYACSGVTTCFTLTRLKIYFFIFQKLLLKLEQPLGIFLKICIYLKVQKLISLKLFTLTHLSGRESILRRKRQQQKKYLSIKCPSINFISPFLSY